MEESREIFSRVGRMTRSWALRGRTHRPDQFFSNIFFTFCFYIFEGASTPPWSVIIIVALREYDQVRRVDVYLSPWWVVCFSRRREEPEENTLILLWKVLWTIVRTKQNRQKRLRKLPCDLSGKKKWGKSSSPSSEFSSLSWVSSPSWSISWGIRDKAIQEKNTSKIRPKYAFNNKNNKKNVIFPTWYLKRPILLLWLARRVALVLACEPVVVPLPCCHHHHHRH